MENGPSILFNDDLPSYKIVISQFIFVSIRKPNDTKTILIPISSLQISMNM